MGCYGLSAKLSDPFTNKDKDLVIRFSLKHELELDCGGDYIKLLGGEVDQSKFGGDAPYLVPELKEADQPEEREAFFSCNSATWPLSPPHFSLLCPRLRQTSESFLFCCE